MQIIKGDIVRSIAGRDKNHLFFVLEVVDENYIMLIDGTIRHVSKPKKKKVKHINFYSNSSSRVRDKIIANELITDAEVRKAIKQQSFHNEGGLQLVKG
jgi:ribosomal protein L14E/L6E/L27E